MYPDYNVGPPEAWGQEMQSPQSSVLAPVFSRTGAEATDCPSEDQPQRLGAGWGELPANHLQAHSLQAPGGRSGPAGRSARVRISSRQLGLNILSSKRFYEPPAAQGDPSGRRKPFLSEQMRLRVVPPHPLLLSGPEGNSYHKPSNFWTLQGF